MKDALELLNSRKEKAKPNLNGMRGSDDMTAWLEILGYSVSECTRPNIVNGILLNEVIGR